MDFFNYTYPKNTATIYASPNLGKREILAKRDKFAVKDLSEEELQAVAAGYGVLVEDVLPLTQSQQWMFSNDMIISANFYIQVLFKINGMIRPQLFNDQIERLIAKYAILRTAFLRETAARPLQVVLKTRSAEIRFHDLANQTAEQVNQTLEKILAADRRRGFDLGKDRLLRIGVFRTGVKEYAVLVAQPQIVADSWDIGLIFAELFLNEESATQIAKQLPKKNFSFTKYLQKRGEQKKELAIQYWQKLLLNLRQTSNVPGYRATKLPRQQAVCAFTVDRVMTKQLQTMAGSSQGFIALLQTVWGVMLQHYNRSNDAVYGVILSNRTAKMENIEVTASIINVMPVRVNCPIDMTFLELWKKQQMQLALSQPYSYCTPQEFQEISALPLFNHFLNFHSFNMESLYTDIIAPFGVTPVCVNSFNCHNAEFGIYFRRSATGLHMDFVYNDIAFSKGQIELLQQGVLAVFRQIIQKPQIQICEIKMPSIAQIESATVDRKTLQAEIRAFFRTIALFANLSDLALEELVDLAKMEYFVEGDVICSEGVKQEKIYVIYSGNVEISRSAENGWAGSLKILKKGSVLGYEGILDQRPSSVRAEAILSDVRIIAIDNKALCIVMQKNFALAVNVMTELNEQVNRFQKLWISART